MALSGALLVGTAYGVYAGERGAREARAGRRRQQVAQVQAENAVASQRRDEMIANNTANQEMPDPTALLAEQLARPGAKPRKPVDSSRVRLGRSTLLGE